MFIDETSRERIGVDRIMQRLRPFSPYGKLARDRMKFFTPGRENQLEGQWQLLASLLEAMAEEPGGFNDIELTVHMFRDVRALIRKSYNGYVLADVELFEIKRFLELSQRLREQMDSFCWDVPSNLILPLSSRLKTSLSRGGNGEGFYLDDRFASQLASLRKEQRQLKQDLIRERKEMQQRVTAETGREFNHLGSLRVGKLEGDILQQLTGRHDLLLAAETYTDVEYVLRDNDKMLKLRRQTNDLEEKIEVQEYAVRKELSEDVAESSRTILAACRRIGSLDLLLTKARLAKETGWCVPTLVTDSSARIEGFTNPVMSEYLTSHGLSFQPLTISLGDTRVTVITGANMGGKSVALKSAGLAVAMAQLGLLVPAESMVFSLRDFVYYSQQDEDLGQGLSTFGAEIQSLSTILPRRDQRGLYLLDEPARGTNPWEGGALVKALMSWLGGGNSLTLAATHFPGLSALEGVTHLQVAGLAGVGREELLDMEKGGIKSLHRLMDYSLIPGKGDIPRDALKVAAFLGLAPEIIESASIELGLSPQEVVLK